MSLVLMYADSNPAPAALVSTQFLEEKLRASVVAQLSPAALLAEAFQSGQPVVSLLEAGILDGFVNGLPPELSPLERYLGDNAERNLEGRPLIAAGYDGENHVLSAEEFSSVEAVIPYEAALHRIVDNYVAVVQAFRMVALGGFHRGDTDGPDRGIAYGREKLTLARARMLGAAQEWINAPERLLPFGRPLLTIGSSAEYRRGLRPRAVLDLDSGELSVGPRRLRIDLSDVAHPRALDKWMKHAVPLFARPRSNGTEDVVLTTDLRFMFKRDLMQ